MIVKNRKNPDIDHLRSMNRIVSFSDAVFAVAITLLVVQIPIPVKAPDRELGDDLVSSIPMFTSYAISFGVIALLWLKHLHFNNHVKRYSVGVDLAEFCISSGDSVPAFSYRSLRHALGR